MIYLIWKPVSVALSLSLSLSLTNTGIAFTPRLRFLMITVIDMVVGRFIKHFRHDIC